MKKILLIFSVFLFLEVFSFSTTSIVPVSATSCCSSGYHYCSGFWSGCFPKSADPTDYSCSGNSVKIACGATETCDNATATCVPNTKDPSCPNDYMSVVPKFDWAPTHCGYDDKCCKKSGENLCLNKNSSNNASINYCSEMADNAILIAKNYCGSDGLWKYNATTKKCESYAASPWNLIATTCQGTQGFDTAIGCIPTGDLKLFLQFILKWAFFASGGIILLLIISTGYTIITSSGNPEKLQGAQENIVALFSGLALIAFSLVLLQAIGADILNLQAFR